MEGVSQVPTKKQREDELLAKMRAAALKAADTPIERIPDNFDARFVYEQESLPTQVVGEVNRSMRRKGMSQQDLAKRLGVSEGRVSQILSGEQNLTFRTLASLAAALRGHFKIVLEEAVGDPWEDDPANSGTGTAAAHNDPSASQQAVGVGGHRRVTAGL